MLLDLHTLILVSRWFVTCPRRLLAILFVERSRRRYHAAVPPATRPKTTQPLRKQTSAARLYVKRRRGNKQERRTAQAVGTVNASGDLAASEKAPDRLATAVEDPGLVINLDTTHSLPQCISWSNTAIRGSRGGWEAGSGYRRA
jgi:hypothetical protein